jgi:hypothetical protein
MLILRGLVVAFGGFVFIFLPGVLISALTRRSLRFDTNLLLWGMGALVVTLFPALFVTSLLRILIFGESAPGTGMLYFFALLGSLIAALFLEGGKYLLLRLRNIPPPQLLDSGILIGLGVGLLTNVFQGISLVGAGFRLALGDSSLPGLTTIASQAWGELLAGLVALNAYRIALVAVSACTGALVAQALLYKQQRWLWLAVLINAVTAWSYNAIGLALGKTSLTANLVVIAYQAVLGALALYWLIRQIPKKEQQPAAQGKSEKAYKR